MTPAEYTRPIHICVDKKLGYPYFTDHTHPLAAKNGKVYLHRHAASVKIGRWLTRTEVVHHIDGDRGNNAPENLVICMSNAEHLRHHHGGVTTVPRTTVECLWCTAKFDYTTRPAKFCSRTCFRAWQSAEPRPRKRAPDAEHDDRRNHQAQGRKVLPRVAHLRLRKFEVSADELCCLIWTVPAVELARRYGVSDVAIYKRCKRFGIPKPPRGYWARARALQGAAVGF